MNTRVALIKNMEQLRNKSISRSPDRAEVMASVGYASEQPASRLRQPNPYSRVPDHSRVAWETNGTQP